MTDEVDALKDRILPICAVRVLVNEDPETEAELATLSVEHIRLLPVMVLATLAFIALREPLCKVEKVPDKADTVPAMQLPDIDPVPVRFRLVPDSEPMFPIGVDMFPAVIVPDTDA